MILNKDNINQDKNKIKIILILKKIFKMVNLIIETLKNIKMDKNKVIYKKVNLIIEILRKIN